MYFIYTYRFKKYGFFSIKTRKIDSIPLCIIGSKKGDAIGILALKLMHKLETFSNGITHTYPANWCNSKGWEANANIDVFLKL